MKYFSSVGLLTGLINTYFARVGIEETLKPREPKNPKLKRRKTKITTDTDLVRPDDYKYEQPAITGLALHLGFDSLASFEEYEARGMFRYYIKRARLLVTAAYERKLLQPSPAGAIFALKTMGAYKHFYQNSGATSRISSPVFHPNFKQQSTLV